MIFNCFKFKKEISKRSGLDVKFNPRLLRSGIFAEMTSLDSINLQRN